MIFSLRFRLPLLVLCAFFCSLKTKAQPAAIVAVLQQHKLLPESYQYRPESTGFSIDTARHRDIRCAALFTEFVRVNTSPLQLENLLRRYGQPTACLKPDSAAVLYAPMETDSLAFVLVEKSAVASECKSAFLVVLKKEGDSWVLIDQSPLCRARATPDKRP